MADSIAGFEAQDGAEGTGVPVPSGAELLGRLGDLVPGIAFLHERRSGRTVPVNDGIQRLLGYSDAQISEGGQRFLFTLIHPDDRFPTTLEEAPGPPRGRADGSERPDFRLRSREEGWKWFEPLESPSGPEGEGWTLHLWIEATRLHRAEEANRIALDRLALTTKAAKIGLWDWESWKEAPLWDASMYELYGIDRDRYANEWEAWRSAVHPDDQERVLRLLHAAMAGEGDFHPEFRIVRPDGSIRIIQSRADAVRDRSGKVVRMAGVSIDITDLRNAEIAIRKSAERLHFALESSRIGAWDLDISQRTATRSGEHARIFGYESNEGEWGFQSFIEHVLPEDRERVVGKLSETIRSGRTMEFECRIRRLDGEIRWLWVAGRVSPGAEGDPGFVVGLVQDITERKLASEELEEYRTRLEELVERRTAELLAANRELDSFCYTVSHDLRAPLRHLDGFVELLVAEESGALSEEGKRFAEIIAKSARKMGVLIDDLLRFSRTSRQDLVMDRVDTASMVAELVQAIDENGNGTGRKVEFEIGELLPVVGDGRLLRQVWSNLLDNAVKYTGRESRPRIEIRCEKRDGEIRFSVRDNGVGFDLTYARKLFGVFQRFHRSDEFEGTGIGLATVHRILSRHSGRIWADSAPGQGATFGFALPDPA